MSLTKLKDNRRDTAQTWHQMKVSGHLHYPTALFPSLLCCSGIRLGGPQGQSGCFGKQKNLFPLPEIEAGLLVHNKARYIS